MESKITLNDIDKFLKENVDNEEVKNYLSSIKETRLDALQRQKGNLITNIELLQNQLQIVNQEIIKELGLQKKDVN